ncbi:hypothetical protein HUU40_09150 [candidate division KSB1 bacterium]|nr:hypothetical protein [candidate division KSB1 bacterium]
MWLRIEATVGVYRIVTGSPASLCREYCETESSSTRGIFAESNNFICLNVRDQKRADENTRVLKNRQTSLMPFPCLANFPNRGSNFGLDFFCRAMSDGRVHICHHRESLAPGFSRVLPSLPGLRWSKASPPAR